MVMSDSFVNTRTFRTFRAASTTLRTRLHAGLTGVHVLHGSVDCDASDLEASQNFAQLQPLSIAARVVYSNLGGGGGGVSIGLS